MSDPLRSILVIAAGMLVISVVAATFVLIAAPDDAETYDPGTPEHTVREYVQAVRDRDVDRAYEMLSPSAQRDVSEADLRDYMRFNYMQEPEWRIRLTGVDVSDDRATVELTLEYSGGGPFGLDRLRRREVVPVVRDDAEWKVDDPFIGW